MAPIEWFEAMSKFAGTPLGFALTCILSGSVALWIDKRYAKTSEIEKLAAKWDLKAESVETLGNEVLSGQGLIHEKINKAATDIARIEGA